MAFHAQAVHTKTDPGPGELGFCTNRCQAHLHGGLPFPSLLCVSECKYWPLDDHLLISHRSFTQVIQDNQFSSLGIVLVAQLAHIQALVTFARDHEQKEPLATLPTNVIESSPRSLIEEFGVAIERTSSGLLESPDPKADSAVPFGQSLSTYCSLGEGKQAKADLGYSEQSNSRMKPNQSSLKEEITTELPHWPKPARRNKSKRANVIDDLFQGLL